MALRRRSIATLVGCPSRPAELTPRLRWWRPARFLLAYVLLLAGLPLALAARAAPLSDRATAAESSALLREVRDYLRQGHLDKALERFVHAAQQRGTPSPKLAQVQWNAEEAQLLASVWLERGSYEEARAVLQPHGQGKQVLPAVLLLQAELERHIGNHADSLKLLTKACQAHPKHLPLRMALGEQLYLIGKAVEARKLLDPLADLYQADEVKTTEDLLAVGRSLQLNDYPKDALQVFGMAEESADDDGQKADVALAFGMLYLQKYNYRDADRSLNQVLALQPKHLAARVALGRIDLQSDHDVARARARLDGVLKDNPRYLPALQLRAEISLYDEDLPAADALLRRAELQRPDFLPVLRVRGAWCKLRDDDACWQQSEVAVRKINKSDGELYLVTATYLEMAHRYKEVKVLLELALQRQPELWQAQAALGMALARQADDVGAKRALEAAYAGDPYDVRTANQLSILYDDALKHMVLLPGSHADVRLHKKERKALERAVVPYVQESVQQLGELYSFAMQRPLQIEIFPDNQQFSVRTVGLPQLGAHAVCFGHLITSRSPAAQPFNWKMVLYHELSHVVHIQATGGRVPRWLTEGLAMMESAWADPRWRPADERRAWDRLKDGKLAQFATFNLAFSQARSMQEILDAYDQAMRSVEFLAERYGRDKVRALALAHQPGKNTVQLLQEVFGHPAAELDRQFAAWLEVKLGRFAKDYRPSPRQIAAKVAAASPPKGQLPPEDAEESDDDPPDDAPQAPAAKPPAAAGDHRQALLAGMRALQRGQLGPAKAALARVTGLQGASAQEAWWEICAAHSLLLEVSVKSGDKAASKLHAQTLIDQPAGRCDGVRQRTVLMALAKAEKQPAQAVAHLRALLSIDEKASVGAAMGLEFAALAWSAVKSPGQEPAASWLVALAPQGEAQLRDQVRVWAASQEHDTDGPELLGKLAWAAWSQAAPAAGTAQDLQRAWLWMEERHPAGRLSPLLEARALVAAGKPAAALAPYRLAADRAGQPSERAEAWCEAELAARAAHLPADQAEAERRCTADRPKPASLTDRPGSAIGTPK